MLMHSDKREERKTVSSGEIAAMVGLKTTKTGHTLCDNNKVIQFESMDFPDPVISVSVEAASKEDALRKHKKRVFDPFLPPFEPGLWITDWEEHRLLFNKFPVHQNHLLVVTKNFVPQESPHTKNDLGAVFEGLDAIDGEGARDWGKWTVLR